jgi:hypothetical protein
LFGFFNGFNCRFYLRIFIFNDKFNISLAVQFTRVGKKYYQANIALAISSLAAKTTALTTQVATATASSGTYGFNLAVGL